MVLSPYRSKLLFGTQVRSSHHLAPLRDAESMASFVRNSGMSNVELKDEDVQQILDTLIYDGKVDKVKDAGISIPVRFHFDRFEPWVRESSPDACVGINVVSGPAQLCVQTISRGTAAKRTHASALWPVPRTMPPPSPHYVEVWWTLCTC